jgi:hypothetical protein
MLRFYADDLTGTVDLYSGITGPTDLNINKVDSRMGNIEFFKTRFLTAPDT